MRNHSNTTIGPQANSTAATDDVTNDAEQYLFITQIVCYFAISIVGTLANVVICVGLSRGRLKSSEYFILNLAIVDLLVCAIGIPLDIYLHYTTYWPYGAFLCHVIFPSQTLLILISIYTLMGMSLERHRAICSPLKQRLSSKFIRASIAFIWLIAVGVVTPYAKALKYTGKYCHEVNWSVEDGKYYTLALLIIDYCIPLTIITYCYAKSGWVLNAKFKMFNRKESTSVKQNMATMKRLKQNKKVIKIFSTAVIVFVICVLPGDCYFMWNSFRTIEYHPYDDHFEAFSTILLYANSAINPFIFGAVQMICHRTFKSQLHDQLTSTTGLSRSKGSGSSIGTGDGMNRNSFSRTGVRKCIKYKSLRTKNEAKEDKKEDSTAQDEHKTKIIYRNTNPDIRDTNANFCSPEVKLRNTYPRNMGNEQLETKHDERDTNMKVPSTNQDFRDANQDMRDTKTEPTKTNHEISEVKYESIETLQNAGSISSDSSATLHPESDTFSITGEMLQNTVTSEVQKQSDCTHFKRYSTEEGNLLHDGNEMNGNEAKKELKNANSEHGNFPKANRHEKENSTDVNGSNEFGHEKIENKLSKCIRTNSIRETDL